MTDLTIPTSVLTRSQKFERTAQNVTVDGTTYKKVVAEVRYDDQCGNGHNSFAITGSAWEEGRRMRKDDPDTCGCIHEIIAVAFPDLAPFIKWHLMSSDQPLHYVANTKYYARTCSHDGYNVGDPVKFETRLKFAEIPFTFAEHEAGFWAWMKMQRDKDQSFININVIEVPHGKEPNTYSPNYTLTDFISTRNIGNDEWYNVPFKTKRQAEEFLLALQSKPFDFIHEPVAWAQAVEPDIEAARRCAKWPDATLEQLQSKEALEARLPAMLNEFKRDMESLGFTY